VENFAKIAALAGFGARGEVMVGIVAAAAAALAVLAASQASAQDFPSGAPRPGFAGAEVGGVVGAAVGGAGDVDTTGVAGGAYAGYNLQNGPLVGGVEGDIMGDAVSGSGRGGKLRHYGTASVRARGGYAFGNVLAYGTIGPAWGASNFERGGYNTDKTLSGYAVGLGAEVAVNRTIAARAELRHYEMGSPTYYTPAGAQKIGNGDNLLIVGVGARF
jgi:outer membrane immunogenic protein